MSSIKVWSRFQRTKKDGSVIKFRIQDLPRERGQDALDLIMNNFMPEEALQKAAGIAKNEEAVAEYIQFYHIRREKPTMFPVMCCLDEETDSLPKILGLSTVEITKTKEAGLTSYSSLMKMVETKELKKVLELLDDIHINYDLIDKYGYESYYDDRGIVVHPDCRRLGIATEFVKQRRQMCEETGVPMSVSWMTSLGTQKAALKDNWETVAEVKFDELGKKHGVVFEDVAPFNKLMICRV